VELLKDSQEFDDLFLTLLKKAQITNTRKKIKQNLFRPILNSLEKNIDTEIIESLVKSVDLLEPNRKKELMEPYLKNFRVSSPILPLVLHSCYNDL